MQRGNTAGPAQSTQWNWRSPFRQRLLMPIVFFIVAFAVDMATSQQYSSVWGSIAIVASLVYLLPSLRPALAAIGTYGGVWAGFNLVRAFAEDAGVALSGRETIVAIERSLFGGTLPSTWLQSRFFDPGETGAHDVLLSLVHGSFFVVPFAVAAIAWRQRRALFRALTLATAITFSLGLVGFLLMPTSPPWLAAPEDVTRVTHAILTDTTGTGADAALGFEPNHFAAMPSVHVAATVLVALVARQFGRIPAILGTVYAVLMSFGVVYLGEHYVVDAVGGWMIALAGWWLMRRVVVPRGDTRSAPTNSWSRKIAGRSGHS